MTPTRVEVSVVCWNARYDGNPIRALRSGLRRVLGRKPTTEETFNKDVVDDLHATMDHKDGKAEGS